MPVLSNSRHERFAQELFKGTSQQKAYVLAGFKEHPSNPSKLAKDKRIIARLAELHSERATIDREAVAKASDALAIDKEWIMARLKENAERALQAIPVRDREGQTIGEYKYDGNVANRALELLGKEIGMFVDRSEVWTGRLDGLSRTERERVLDSVDRELARRSGGASTGGQAKPH